MPILMITTKAPADAVVELYEHLERLKISNAEFARHIDVRPNTLSRWLTRKTKVPRVVVLYLRQLTEAPPPTPTLVRQKPKPLPSRKPPYAGQERDLRRKSR